jgi:DNA-binding NtrC family response regulator
MSDNKSLKIFLLDDDPFCMAIYHQHLENMGYKDISCFTDANSCLDNLMQQPDVVFADYSIGFGSGINTLNKIKRFNPDIYVIFFSGHEEVEIAVNSVKQGAFDYIVKGPEETEKIKKALQKIHHIQKMLYNNKSLSLKRFFFMLF